MSNLKIFQLRKTTFHICFLPNYKISVFLITFVNKTYLKFPTWYATTARALSTASQFNISCMFGSATGKLQRKRANRSISPESSSVLQTISTWAAEKASVGIAKMGLGAMIWWAATGAGEKFSWGGCCLPSVGPTAILFVESTVNKFAYYTRAEMLWNFAGF